MYRGELAASLRGLDRDGLAAAGHLPGIDGTDLMHADPITDESIRPVGESEEGVAFRRTPEAMLRDDPELHAIANRYYAGAYNNPSYSDLVRMSGVEATARAVLLSAERRDAERRIRERSG